MRRLANLTRELNVTLWIHDHYRKEGGGGKKRKELDLSSLKGTGGKPQNADSYILMERAGDTIKVLVSSKDTDQKPRFLLRVSPEGSGEEKFQYAGDLEDAANDMKQIGEQNKLRVLNAFDVTEWRSRKAVAKQLRISPSTVSKHATVLVDNKELEQQESRGIRI